MKYLVSILFFALTVAYCSGLNCYKCNSIVLMDGDANGACYDGTGKDLATVSCKTDEVCMKFLFEAHPTYLVIRDCSRPDESCADFEKRSPMGVSAGAKGKVTCSTCKDDKCNSSSIATSSILLCIVLAVFGLVFH